MTEATATSAQQLDELCVNTIRTLSMDAVEKASSGHPGTPMALAPLAYALYAKVMKHSPEHPDWFDRDRFVLSAGHASMLLYSSLYLSGYGLTLDDLKNFRQLGSPTAGHPEYEYREAPGIEATTGPLGQGVGMAVGMALAEAMLSERHGKELVDHNTWVIASDGDLQEGIASEACSLAGHLGLGKLVVFYDNNHIQLAGGTEMSFSEDVGKRFEAYGWHVQDVGEDLSVDNLVAAAEAARDEADRPSLVMVRSHIGYGAPDLQDTYKAHGNPLGEEEIRGAKEFYGWDPDAEFLVPDEALEHFRELASERGRQAQADWQERLDALKADDAESYAALEPVIERRMNDGWDEGAPSFSPDDDDIATRKASAKVIQWAAERVPQLVSGSADLEPSTNTEIEDGGSVERGAYGGRNVHYGVREHAMGAIVNGLNLHGLRAFGSTFFNFLDYQKPAVRLAALMHLPSIFVYTHDSIGLGEDGPTHQPVEQLAALRAQPNTYVVRPADANETVHAWRFALGESDSAVALVFSRQNLPILDPERVPADSVDRGAYVLRDSDGDPELILIGTGSEVSLCVETAEKLEADGVAVRVVSAPCLDRFAEQDEAYRDEVLPPAVRARVSVEAASELGWAQWVTDDGASVGMTSFGASAPYQDLYERFGFTPEKVAEQGKNVLERLTTRSG